MSDNDRIEMVENKWQKFTEGDDNALSAIYFDFFDLLLNFGLKYTSDRFLVEDCIQNLFIDLLKNRGKQLPVNNLRFYMMKAVRNQMAIEQRKTKKLVSLERPEENDFRISYSVEKMMIASETNQMQSRFLQIVTENLTSRQKEALYLKFNCGFDYQQISELMEISVESSRTLIYRTLKSLKETFGTQAHLNLLLFGFFRQL